MRCIPEKLHAYFEPTIPSSLDHLDQADRESASRRRGRKHFSDWGFLFFSVLIHDLIVDVSIGLFCTLIRLRGSRVQRLVFVLHCQQRIRGHLWEASALAVSRYARLPRREGKRRGER